MARSRSIQKRLQKTRASRIQISYADKLVDGSTSKAGQIDFVIGVIADMSINHDPDRAPLRSADRKFVTINADNFDQVLKGFKAHLKYQVEDVINGRGKSFLVELKPKNISDLEPDQVIRQVGLLRDAEDAMMRLASLNSLLDNHPEIEERLSDLVTNPDQLARLLDSIEPKAAGSEPTPGAPE